MAWVYILHCADGTYYTGSTPNLERRLAEHQAGDGGTWTSSRLPLQLMFSYEVEHLRDAFELERQIKGWRRAKKQALIGGDYSTLPKLADTRR